MPTHALLGATGATGSAILRTLLSSPQQPDNFHLNILVRSESKLLALFPTLSFNKSIEIHLSIGSYTDSTPLTESLRNAEVIYNCIATNEIKRGQDLARRSAEAIIACLEELRREEGWRIPTVLFNRTIALNPLIPNPVPAFLDPLLSWSLDWAFEDLRAACYIYQKSSPSLLHYIFVDPPKLVDPEGVLETGFRLVKGEGEVMPAFYYKDLGKAFVEVAGRQGEFLDGAVGVGAKGRVRENPLAVLGALGLLGRGVLGRVLGI